MGTTFTENWLKREYEIARNDPDSSNIANFYRQHLNIHTQEVMGVDRWIPLETWDRQADPSITLDNLLDWSDYVWCGIDAGVRDDATALLVLGRKGEDGDEQMQVWSHQWLHRDGYDKRKAQAPYDEFIGAGELTVCDRDSQDMAEMVGLIEDRIEKSGKLAAIGADQHKLTDTITQLEDMGITVLAIPQGWQISKYIIKTDRLIHKGKIKHFGGPMLRFNVQNGQLQERGRGMALTKPGDIGVSKHKIRTQ